MTKLISQSTLHGGIVTCFWRQRCCWNSSAIAQWGWQMQ